MRIFSSHLLHFFNSFLCPTRSGKSRGSFSFPIHEQFILLLPAKLAPSVIISWCLCAFTSVSQQGPVLAQTDPPALLPLVMWLPIRKFPKRILNFPAGQVSSFRPQGFTTTHLCFQSILCWLRSFLFGYSFIQTTPAICIISITLEVYTVITMNRAVLPTSAHYILTKKLRGKSVWVVNSVWGEVQREGAYIIATHNASPLSMVELCLLILKFKLQSGTERFRFRRGFC